MLPEEPPASSDLSGLGQGCGADTDYRNSLQNCEEEKNLSVYEMEQHRADYVESKEMGKYYRYKRAKKFDDKSCV